jgi:hypothetical protein
MRRNGELSLEPALLVETRPSIPTAGSHRVEGIDDSGAVVWSQSFDLRATTHPTDESSAGFCFAAPMAPELLDAIVTLRVVSSGTEFARRSASAGKSFRSAPAPFSAASIGGGVELRWDASVAPVVMVRDLDRDQCVGFARDGHATITGVTGRLELRFSDGVHTRVQVWPEE